MGLINLSPLRGLMGLSFKDQYKFYQDNVAAGTLSPDATYQEADQLFRNGQAYDLFGEEEFNRLSQSELNKKLEDHLTQNLFDSYYKGNIDDKTYDYWNTNLTTQGKQEMLGSVLNQRDFDEEQKKREEEEKRRQREQSSYAVTDNNLIRSFGRAAEPMQPLLEHQAKEKEIEGQADLRNSKINDIIDRDKLRRLDLAEPRAIDIQNQWMNAIDNGQLDYSTFDKMWNDISPYLSHWEAFKNEEELADFTEDDKIKALAKYEAMREQFGDSSAIEALNADIQNHVATNQDAWDKTKLALGNLVTGTVGTMFGEVNGLIGLGVRAIGGEDAFADWLQSDWKRYWDGVDHFNTFSPSEINRARENGGVSPNQRIRGVGEEFGMDYNTFLDMAQMAKFIVPALLSKGAVGKITKALSTGNKVWDTALGVAGALESGVGIADAYASGTYDEVLLDGTMKVDAQIDKELDAGAAEYLKDPEVQARAATKAAEFYNNRNNVRTLQAILDSDEIQEKISHRVDDYFDNPELSAGVLDTPETRQQLRDQFAQEEVQDALRKNFLGEEAQAYKDNHRQEVEDAHAQDRREVELDAAAAYANNATLETLRMAGENALFRKWMLSNGTKANLGMSNPYLGVQGGESGVEMVGKWRNRIKPIAQNVWGGFQSNYLDDVTARLGKEFGLSYFDNYMAKHYDPERYDEAVDNVLSHFAQAASEAAGAFGEKQSFWDGFIGAGGSIVQGFINIPGIWNKHFSKAGRTAEAIEARKNRSVIEKINDYFYNPILQEVGEAMQRERNTQQAIDMANKHIAENGNTIDATIELMTSSSDETFGYNSGDHMTAADMKAQLGISLVKHYNQLIQNPFYNQHHLVRDMNDNLNRILNAKEPSEISDFVEQYLDRNKLEHNEENTQEAFKRIQKNANRFREIQSRVAEAEAKIDKTKEGKTLEKEIRDQLIFQYVMGDNWEKRRDGMLEEVGITPGLDTSPVVQYGSRKVLDQKIEAQKKTIQKIDEIIKNLQEEYKSRIEKGVPKIKEQKQKESSEEAPQETPQGQPQQAPAETNTAQPAPSTGTQVQTDEGAASMTDAGSAVDLESADYEKQETSPAETAKQAGLNTEAPTPPKNPNEQKSKWELQKEEENKWKRENVLLDREIKTLKERRIQEAANLSKMYDALSLYDEDGKAPVITSGEMLSLNINDLAYMLDPKNLDEYSPEQQSHILAATNYLISKDGDAIQKIQDAAELNRRIERNQQTANRILKSPIEANFLNQFMRDISIAGREEYLWRKKEEGFFNELDAAYAADEMQYVGPNYHPDILKDWYEERGIPADENVIGVSQLYKDIVDTSKTLGYDDGSRNNLVRAAYGLITQGTSREEAMEKLNKAAEDMAGQPVGIQFSELLKGLEKIEQQRTSTTTENTKQRQEREAKEKIAKEKQTLAEEKAKKEAEAAAQTAAEKEKDITDAEQKGSNVRAEVEINRTKPVKAEAPFAIENASDGKVYHYTQTYKEGDDVVTSVVSEKNDKEVDSGEQLFPVPPNMEVSGIKAESVKGLKEMREHPDGTVSATAVVSDPLTRERTVNVKLQKKDNSQAKEEGQSQASAQESSQAGQKLSKENNGELDGIYIKVSGKDGVKTIEFSKYSKDAKTKSGKQQHLPVEITTEDIVESDVDESFDDVEQIILQKVRTDGNKASADVFLKKSYGSTTSAVSVKLKQEALERLMSSAKAFPTILQETNQVEGSQEGQSMSDEVNSESQISQDEGSSTDILNADNALGEDTVNWDDFEDSRIDDDGEMVGVHSPTIEEQVSTLAAAGTGTVSESFVNADDVNDVGEQAVDTSTTALPGNYMFDYVINSLKYDGKLRRKEGKEKNDRISRYFRWLDAAKIKSQNITDEELGRILVSNPNPAVHFMAVRREYNATNDADVKETLFLVLDYDDKVNKNITFIHNEKNGGVIESNGKKYLIIGNMDVLKDDNHKSQLALKDAIYSSDPKTPGGFGLVVQKMVPFFKQNPSERFYVSDFATEIVPQSLTPGYIVKQTLTDNKPQDRKISDLLSDPSRNIYNFKLKDFVFGFQEYSKFYLSDESYRDLIMFPRNRIKNAGNAFFLVPAGNGKFVVSYIKPCMYTEMYDSELRDEVGQSIAKLASPNYADRLDAVMELSDVFYLDKEHDYILLGRDDSKYKGTISFTKDGKPFRTFNANSVSLEDLIEAFTMMNPRVNITADVLSSESELKKYDDAGALLTDCAYFNTAGSVFRIYPVNRNGEVVKPTTTDNSIFAVNSDYRNEHRQWWPYRDQKYLYNKDEGKYYLNGQLVTDAATIKNLDYNRRVVESALSPVKKYNEWDMYILGTEENAEVIRINRYTKEVVVAPTDKAREISDTYFKEKRDKEREESALKELEDMDEFNKKHADDDMVDLDMNPETGELNSVEGSLEETGLTDAEEPTVSTDEAAQEQQESPQEESPAQSPQQAPAPTTAESVAKAKSSLKTASFEDLSKNEFFFTRVLNIISKKWPGAPTDIKKLSEFLRGKKNAAGMPIEVDAIDTSMASLRAWMKTLDECR